jgi:hypothetical protein
VGPNSTSLPLRSFNQGEKKNSLTKTHYNTRDLSENVTIRLSFGGRRFTGIYSEAYEVELGPSPL